MKRTLLAGCAAAALAALAAAPAMAQQKTIKIGFISTFSGPVAAIGNDMRQSFELGLDHLGRKLGGLPVEVIYEDDQLKPEVGVQKTQKLIESDKVDFVVGYIWSNVALASLKPLVDSKTFTIITNAGASQISGELCSPYVFTTSWNNDQTPQAVGLYMNQKNVKTAFLIGPNYAAGKDMLEGVASTFKGQIIGRELTLWPNQLDFSAELSKARAAKPEAIFAFYPGGAGIQFVTQYAQSGLKGQIPLYTAFTIDELSLPRLKDLAVGIPGAQQWVNDLPNDANKKYVADYKAKYKSSPSFYGSQTYDAAALIDSGLKAVKGDMSKKDELRKALEKADFKSVRGNFKFGPNHIPIQNFYLQEAVKEGDDYRLKTVATIVENDQDKHVGKCKMPN
ncbi:MAG: ABC transporter substrate-binding protein [Xanthobacteraceae bacterium]|nr:ABC transporter substrate-binding protein [Xanthobacteraceae bacterium]